MNKKGDIIAATRGDRRAMSLTSAASTPIGAWTKGKIQGLSGRQASGITGYSFLFGVLALILGGIVFLISLAYPEIKYLKIIAIIWIIASLLSSIISKVISSVWYQPR